MITILFMFAILQTGFAADVPISNTTSGGINGAITAGTTNHGDTILLTPGTYTGTNNTGITINKNVTIQGNGPTNQVIIDAEGQRRIFTIAANTNVTFINITFLNGNNTTGGAISNRNTNSLMTIINCNFTNNTATANNGGGGGAIFNLGSALTVDNCIFTDNVAGSNGGAIYTRTSNIIINGSTFINNFANTSIGSGADNGGGAISTGGGGNIHGGINITLANCVFINNSANHHGGAIYSRTSNIIINGSTFINNFANTSIGSGADNGGGAISTGGGGNIHGGINITLANCVFINNSANHHGGAIYKRGGEIAIDNCVFIGNNASLSGGAFYTYQNHGGTVVNNSNVITHSNFTNNSAGTNGGALSQVAINFDVENCIFIGNTATATGGAIASSISGNVVKDNIFINNSAGTTGGAIINSAAGLVLPNSVFENNSAGTNGGAIWNSGANFTIENSNFTNNSANEGGAILSQNANFSVSDSMFIDNFARTANGGAIRNNGHDFSLSNSVFENNSATTNGGAIFHQNGANSTIENSIFINNSANLGGAIIIRAGANFSVSDSSFVNNLARTTTGGAIHNNGVDFSLSNSVFENNSANTTGGAIHNNAAGFNLSTSFFENNSAATNGGAIWSSGANITITNNNFTTNTAGTSGGGIFSNDNAVVTVINNDFTTNTAGGNGGSISNGNGNMSLSGNTMSGNSAGLGQMIFNRGNMGILNLTFISNSTLVTKIGSITTLYASLTDDMGNTVTGQNISFYLNGVLYENVEVIEGLAEVNFTATPLGDIPVSGEYAGNGDFAILINDGLLRVIKIDVSTTVVVPENVTVGREINITGVLTDDEGNPLDNIDLTVTVDGKTYTVKTDSNGQWSLPYLPTHTGNIEASVSWAGNDTHNGFNKSTNFKVAKRNIIVTINVTENPDGSVTVIANATYEDGSPAPGYPVDFLLDGKIIGTGVTGSNGIATLTIPANKISDGPHTISVVVTGGDNANDATASTEFRKTSKDNPTNKTSNKPAATAAMKNTGIPIIAIILLLLTGLGLFVKRKN